MTAETPILGILGGGQLGRMLAEAAAALGVRAALYDPSPDACARFAAPVTTAPWDDLDAVRRFAEPCVAVTYEFENVPEATARAVADTVPLRPGLEPLLIAQDRARERALFKAAGLETPRWAEADSADELAERAAGFPLPAIVKARQGGYDGKGQAIVATPDEAAVAFRTLGSRPVIIDELVGFDREVSQVVARSATAAHGFPLAENTHRRGILIKSAAPAADVAGPSPAVDALADRLGYLGVMAVEFFEVGGRLLANELAPRVHNTGHWTIDGAARSQFELHVRAVLGMALDPAGLPDRPTVMANLIGAVPNDHDLAALPGACRVHLYGKPPRPGRKLGHVNILADELPGGLGEAHALADALIAGNVYAD